MSLVKRNNILFPTLMNEIFKPDWFGGLETASSGTVPSVNILEKDNGYELQLAVPGLKKEDLVVEINANVLTISAKVAETKETSEQSYTRKEFSYSNFERAFSLPKTVATDNIEASYENGILLLALPKREEALPKPKRTIEISSN